MTNLVDSTFPGRAKRSLGSTATQSGVVIGRYYGLHAKIGVGGMASVHLGWLAGAADFSRVVAIKRMHPLFAADEHFAVRFRDEARLSARLSHPNIVQVFDVVERNRELLIIMEYVHGVSLGNLARDAKEGGLRLPPSVIAGVLVPTLHGLHAAHEATDDDGHPIGIVHRDFSPQNIMVSCDGHSKILDFGVAKATTHLHVTSIGKFSGKLGYCAPEQAGAGVMDRRTDVFAAGIVLWEMLTAERLFHAPGITDVEAFGRVLSLPIPPPSSINPEVPSRVDEIVLHALQRKPENRFASARELASELEAAVDIASPSTIAQWVESACAKRMARLNWLLDSTRRRMARAQPGLAGPGALPEEGMPAESLSAPDVPTPVTASKRPARWAEVTWVKLALAVVLVVVASGISFRSTLFGSAHEALTVPTVSSPPPAHHLPEVFPVPAPPGAGADPPALPQPSEPLAGPAEFHTRRPRIRASRPRHETGKPRPRQTASAKGLAQPNCNPPTYLDADGIRVFKDECL